jgi:hypothetical protein
MSEEIQIVKFDNATIDKLQKLTKLYREFWKLKFELENDIGKKYQDEIEKRYDKKNIFKVHWNHLIESDGIEHLLENDGEIFKNKSKIEETLHEWALGEIELQAAAKDTNPEVVKKKLEEFKKYLASEAYVEFTKKPSKSALMN